MAGDVKLPYDQQYSWGTFPVLCAVRRWDYPAAISSRVRGTKG